MKYKSYFKQAITNLTSAKLRSFLAILGIVIGSASIVALINSSLLATNAALEQFKNLGTHILSVSIYSTKQKTHEDNISLNTWQQLPKDIAQIKNIAPFVTSYQTSSFKGRKLNGNIIGANEALAEILEIQLASGSFISTDKSFQRLCVIGSALAKQIEEISFQSPIGKQVRIDNLLYTIIGVAKPWQENGFFLEDINQSIIIPLNDAPLVIKDPKIRNSMLSLYTDDNLDQTMALIKGWVHDKAPEAGMFMRSAKQIVQSMESQGKIFTLLLTIIGSIALLVGGIGVMNIMLVAVSERKKEIGLRKALGAKNREIQKLFLTEALLLSIFGGTVGLFLGLLITYIIAGFNQWAFYFYSIPILLGFGSSVLTGIFFGFYPAKRASKLEPIVCLRSE